MVDIDLQVRLLISAQSYRQDIAPVNFAQRLFVARRRSG